MRRFLFVFVVALSLVGCASQSPPPPSSSPVSTENKPSASPVAVVPTASPTPTPTATPSPSPNPTPIPTAKPTPVCLAAQLAAKVTSWQGAAGHQIASVTLTNTSSQTCIVQGVPEIELLDAHGGILIDSQTGGPGGLPNIPPGSPAFQLVHGASLQTMVEVGNYCGAAAALPTTVAFVLPASAGRLVAAPGPGGSTPSCLGSPGSLGSIAMNGWTK